MEGKHVHGTTSHKNRYTVLADFLIFVIVCTAVAIIIYELKTHIECADRNAALKAVSQELELLKSCIRRQPAKDAKNGKYVRHGKDGFRRNFSPWVLLNRSGLGLANSTAKGLEDINTMPQWSERLRVKLESCDWECKSEVFSSPFDANDAEKYRLATTDFQGLDGLLDNLENQESMLYSTEDEDLASSSCAVRYKAEQACATAENLPYSFCIKRNVVEPSNDTLDLQIVKAYRMSEIISMNISDLNLTTVTKVIDGNFCTRSARDRQQNPQVAGRSSCPWVEVEHKTNSSSQTEQVYPRTISDRGCCNIFSCVAGEFGSSKLSGSCTPIPERKVILRKTGTCELNNGTFYWQYEPIAVNTTSACVCACPTPLRV